MEVELNIWRMTSPFGVEVAPVVKANGEVIKKFTKHDNFYDNLWDAKQWINNNGHTRKGER